MLHCTCSGEGASSSCSVLTLAGCHVPTRAEEEAVLLLQERVSEAQRLATMAIKEADGGKKGGRTRDDDDDLGGGGKKRKKY